MGAFRSRLIMNSLAWGFFGFRDTLQKLSGTSEWSLFRIHGSHRALHIVCTNTMDRHGWKEILQKGHGANKSILVGLVGFMYTINYFCGATIVYINTGKAHQGFPGMLKCIFFLVRVPYPDSYNTQVQIVLMPRSAFSNYSYLTPVVYLFILVQIA